VGEKHLLNQMLELVFKANALIEIISPTDSVKLIEMAINRKDIMLDKSRLVVLRVDKMFLVIPLTITKVETRLRNVLINGKPKFDGLSRFMQFYLQSLEILASLNCQGEKLLSSTSGQNS
jgi:hypothetical protein